MTPLDVFLKLQERTSCHYDDGRILNSVRSRNEEIPDRLLPGRMLSWLNDEEREILKNLKSEELTKLRPMYK